MHTNANLCTWRRFVFKTEQSDLNFRSLLECWSVVHAAGHPDITTIHTCVARISDGYIAVGMKCGCPAGFVRLGTGKTLCLLCAALAWTQAYSMRSVRRDPTFPRALLQFAVEHFQWAVVLGASVREP